jgi:tRNA A37 threonylcarbamoyladenosine biosynthesis protein TsaE
MHEESELEDLRFNEMVKSGNVIVVEWAEKIRGLLKRVSKQKNVSVLRISITGKREQRNICFYIPENDIHSI